MSEIDHTANLILNRNEDENIESRVNGYYVHLRHLKAMAKLWLMRKEIVNKLETLARVMPFPTEKDGRDMLAKIEALEKE